MSIVSICADSPVIVIGKIFMMGRSFVTKKELHEHCARQMENIELKIENAVIRATLKGMKQFYRKNGNKG